jgi:hypothetical protein
MRGLQPYADFRALFRAARDKYNDADRGLFKIKNYPFKRHKVIEAPMTPKRAWPIEKIRKIRDYKCIPGSRAELARDIFMLSFYLCGMNAKEIL